MKKLVFTLPAWAKLLYLRDKGKTEVSFFAISSKEDIGLVEDVLMVPQRCNSAWTEFKDEGTADYTDAMVDAGYELERCTRIWCHTHPGNSATPSGQDESTFKDTFGGYHWAIMFILAKDGTTTCKLRVKTKALSDKFQTEDVIKDIPAMVAFPLEGFNTTLHLGTQSAETAIDWKKVVREEAMLEWDAEYDRNWSYKEWNQNKTTNSGPNYNNFSHLSGGRGAPRIGDWRSAKRPFYGPGWRRKSGRWMFTTADEDHDESAGRSCSPDYPDWYENIYGEKYYPPGMEPKRVSLQRLETNRNLLTTQDDGNFGWHPEADETTGADVELVERSYTVELPENDKRIPEKYRGKRISGVWASCGITAMQKAYAKLGLPPFVGKLRIDGDQVVDVSPPEEDDDLLLLEEPTDLDLLSETDWIGKKNKKDMDRIEFLMKLEKKGQLTVKQQSELEALLWEEDDEPGLLPLQNFT